MICLRCVFYLNGRTKLYFSPPTVVAPCSAASHQDTFRLNRLLARLPKKPAFYYATHLCETSAGGEARTSGASAAFEVKPVDMPGCRFDRFVCLVPAER